MNQLLEKDPGRHIFIRLTDKKNYKSFLKGLTTNSKEWLRRFKVKTVELEEDSEYFIEIIAPNNKEAVEIGKRFETNLASFIRDNILEIRYRIV